MARIFDEHVVRRVQPLNGADMNAKSEELYALCRRVADCEESKSEANGYYDIAIFKDGVTL